MILNRTFEGKLVSQDASDEPASGLLKRIQREKAGKGKNESYTEQIFTAGAAKAKQV